MIDTVLFFIIACFDKHPLRSFRRALLTLRVHRCLEVLDEEVTDEHMDLAVEQVLGFMDFYHRVPTRQEIERMLQHESSK